MNHPTKFELGLLGWLLKNIRQKFGPKNAQNKSYQLEKIEKGLFGGRI